MKILVALKQVPDTESRIKVAADGKSLDPADVKWITSPYDEYALEEAIRIKEGKGAEVVALSVGSDAAKDVLKNALALSLIHIFHAVRRGRLAGPDAHGVAALESIAWTDGQGTRPVSYTHLDVYKRQVAVRTRARRARREVQC